MFRRALWASHLAVSKIWASPEHRAPRTRALKNENRTLAAIASRAGHARLSCSHLHAAGVCRAKNCARRAKSSAGGHYAEGKGFTSAGAGSCSGEGGGVKPGVALQGGAGANAPESC